MSVNDALPWIAPALELIRTADAHDIPVIGHCLGGQLMSRAFGGQVTRNAVKEIGWGEVSSAGTPLAVEWLGNVERFEAFHWHGETFSIPPGATRILGNAHCANQAFLRGPHLGMQCHVEMTSTMIESWSRHWDAEGVPASASVQAPAMMLEGMEARITAMRIVADRLYQRWCADLRC